MNASFRTVLLLLLVFFGGPGFGQSPGNTTVKTLVLNRTDSCSLNQKHTYQVFVPSVEQSNRELPLIVVIDQHGDGKMAVARFKNAAQKYQAVVVGSNLIRNNDTTFLQKIDELIADVKIQYPVGNALYMGGFSGGARMAIEYASSHSVNGVIACGALGQLGQLSLLTCKIMLVIGMDDFNFIETAPFVLNPLQIPSNLSIEITKESHAWPENKLLQQAMGYLLFATPSGNMTDKRILIREFVDEQKRRIDSLNQTNENIQAVLVARNMSSSYTFERESSFLALSDQLMQNENYKLQINTLTQCFQFETKAREGYYNTLFQKDTVWWGQEIDFLNSKIKSEKDEYTQMTYQRIKEFLKIVCYSFCQRFTREKEAQKLEQVLSVFRIVEPLDPDLLKFVRILDQMKRSKQIL